MKILLVSSFLPFPLDSGGHVRLFNLLKQLSKNHEITLVCEKRQYQNQKDIQEVKKYCEDVITFPRRKQWTLKNILRSGFSRYPFLLVGHTLPKMKKNIVHLLNQKHFDLVHVETSYVYQNLPKTYLPVVLVEHNIEYLVYQRFLQTVPQYLRFFLQFDVWKIKYWEEEFWKQASQVVAVSEEEKEIIGQSNVAIVPNGVDIHIFKESTQKQRKEKKVLFIGNFKWIQNQKAAEWILKEIWPVIEQKDSKTWLWIVGKNIPPFLKEIGGKHVLFDENADEETWKIYKKADILLAPITVGGGTSYKILEAMASGVPVVTTKLGIVGIHAKENVHALVGADAKELADQVLKLLSGESIVKKLTKNARTLVVDNFSWENISEKLELVYKNIALH